MNKRGEGCIELNDELGTLEANRIANFITVDSQRNNGGVNQADLDVRIISLERNFFASLLSGVVLDFFDD